MFDTLLSLKYNFYSLVSSNRRVRSVKNHSHLFKRMTFRLWIEEIHCEGNSNQDDGENDIVFPANSIKSDGVDKCVEKEG